MKSYHGARKSHRIIRLRWKLNPFILTGDGYKRRRRVKISTVFSIEGMKGKYKIL